MEKIFILKNTNQQIVNNYPIILENEQELIKGDFTPIEDDEE